ncbi:MAG: NAD(P)-dependent dehydrogenase (short-subunit alcohol dehydrogenase family) [Myxococcota bacterium]
MACCRRSSDALDGLGVRVIPDVDVSDDASVAALAERLDGQSLDLLINNAGILEMTSLEGLDLDSCRRQFEVNSLGPLRVTHALLPNLQPDSKVAIITSRMGSIADNTSGGAYGYRMSKAAVNAAGKSLALDLAPRQIAVTVLHPGWVRTEMTRNSGLMDAHESAAGLLARIDELTLETTGRFRHMNGDPLPW